MAAASGGSHVQLQPRARAFRPPAATGGGPYSLFSRRSVGRTLRCPLQKQAYFSATRICLRPSAGRTTFVGVVTAQISSAQRRPAAAACAHQRGICQAQQQARKRCGSYISSCCVQEARRGAHDSRKKPLAHVYICWCGAAKVCALVHFCADHLTRARSRQVLP